MNYGPELVAALADELKTYIASPLLKIDGGGNHCIFSFKGKPPLFLTWDGQVFGICSLLGDDAREMRAVSTKTPLLFALQKRLGGAELTDVSAVKGDRVLVFAFRKFVGGGAVRTSRFVLELTGRMSNAVLLDEDGTIIEAARHVYPNVNRYRTIVPGTEYVPPPPMGGTEPTEDMDDAELLSALRRPLGLGRTLAAELTRLCEGGFYSLVRDALFARPPIFQRIGNYLTAAGAELPSAAVRGGTGLGICRAEVAGEIRRRSLKGIASRALKLLDRTSKSRARHADGLRNRIEKFENCEQFRQAGEALLQNIGRVKIGSGQTSLSLKYWDADGEREIKIAVDPSLGVQANAKNYFKKYKKYSADVGEARTKLEELLEEMDDIAALKANIERVADAERLTGLCEQVAQQYEPERKAKPQKKQKKALPPHLRFTLGESLILVGMNERGNRFVTFQEASPDDLWFHVHERPGSHVILKNPPEDADALARAVRAAASLALFYSKCEDGTSVIDYTQKKHVRHIQGAGPANVTYKHPSTVLVARGEWEGILKG